MKKNLTHIFILIFVALSGIVIFQTYWTVSAYHVNKKNFRENAERAMQAAMDDCKKDYFDSIRRVFVGRLSPPMMDIRIDTTKEEDTAHAKLSIQFYRYGVQQTSPYITFKQYTDYYKKKIGRPSTLAELVAEMSFYQPRLMGELVMLFSMQSLEAEQPGIAAIFGGQPKNKRSTGSHKQFSFNQGVYQLPPKYREADSLKLTRYLKKQLNARDIRDTFQLLIATKHFVKDSLSKQLETGEYSYQYHGFKFLQITTGAEFFIKARFINSKSAVIKSMLYTLILSFLLILFTCCCFLYIIRTFIRQKKLSDLKDDFINNITHELKTPIATITVAIEAMQSFKALDDPQKTARYLQTSRNELTKLNDLVTRVLNIASFENHDMALSKSYFSIGELVESIIADQQATAQKPVSINYAGTNNLSDIYADQWHLRTLLTNLIDNAVKYSGPEVKIDIVVKRRDQKLFISIKDNGIGIAAADIGQLFDKFYRVPTGKLHNVKGTGLGLSYVKYIAEAHGGTVSVKSELNKGSEFMVLIPLSNE